MRNSVNKTSPIYKVLSANNIFFRASRLSSFYQVRNADKETYGKNKKSEKESIPIDLENHQNQDDFDKEQSTKKNHLIPYLTSCHHVKRQNRKTLQDANSEPPARNLKIKNDLGTVNYFYNNDITTYRDKILNYRDTNYTDRNINGQADKRLATLISANRYRQSFVRLFSKPCYNVTKADDLTMNHLKQIRVKKKFINEYMRTIINGIPKDDLYPFKLNSKEISVRERDEDSDRQKFKLTHSHFKNSSTIKSEKNKTENQLNSVNNGDHFQSGINVESVKSNTNETPSAQDPNIKVYGTVSIKCTSLVKDDAINALPKTYNVNYDFSSNSQMNHKISGSISRSSFQSQPDNKTTQKNANVGKELLNYQNASSSNAGTNRGDQILRVSNDDTNQHTNDDFTTNEEKDKQVLVKESSLSVSKKLADTAKSIESVPTTTAPTTQTRQVNQVSVINNQALMIASNSNTNETESDTKIHSVETKMNMGKPVLGQELCQVIIEPTSDNTRALTGDNEFAEVKSIEPNPTNSNSYTQSIKKTNIQDKKTPQNKTPRRSKRIDQRSQTNNIPIKETNVELLLDIYKTARSESSTYIGKIQSTNNETILNDNVLQPSNQKKIQSEKNINTINNEFNKKSAEFQDNYTRDTERNYKISLDLNLNPNSSVKSDKSVKPNSLLSGKSVKPNSLLSKKNVDSANLETKQIQKVEIETPSKAEAVGRQGIKENKTDTPLQVKIEKCTDTADKTKGLIESSKHENLRQIQFKELQQVLLNAVGLKTKIKEAKNSDNEKSSYNENRRNLSNQNKSATLTSSREQNNNEELKIVTRRTGKEGETGQGSDNLDEKRGNKPKEIITNDRDTNAQLKTEQHEMSNEQFKLKGGLKEGSDNSSDSKQIENQIGEKITNKEYTTEELQNLKGDDKDLRVKKIQYKKTKDSEDKIVLATDKNQIKENKNQETPKNIEGINSSMEKRGDIDKITAMLEDQRILLESLLAKVNSSSRTKFSLVPQTLKLAEITKTDIRKRSSSMDKLENYENKMKIIKKDQIQRYVETYPRIHSWVSDEHFTESVDTQANNGYKKSHLLNKMNLFHYKKPRNNSNTNPSSQEGHTPGGYLPARKLSESRVKYKEQENYASSLAQHSYNPLKHLLSQCTVNYTTQLLNLPKLNFRQQPPNKSDTPKNLHLNTHNRNESQPVSYAGYLKTKEQKNWKYFNLMKKKNVAVTPRKIININNIRNKIKNKNNFNNLFNRKLDGMRIKKPEPVVNLKIEPPKSEDQLLISERTNHLKLSKGIMFVSKKAIPKPNIPTWEDKKPDYITRLKNNHIVNKEKQSMKKSKRENNLFNNDIRFNFTFNSNQKSLGAFNRDDLASKLFHSQSSDSWAEKIEFESWKNPIQITPTKAVAVTKKSNQNKKPLLKNNARETIEYLTSLAQKLNHRQINLNNSDGLNLIKSSAVPLEIKMFTGSKRNGEMSETATEYSTTTNLASLLKKTQTIVNKEDKKNFSTLDLNNLTSPPIRENLVEDDKDRQPLQYLQTAVNEPVTEDSPPLETSAEKPLINIKNKFLSKGINSAMLMMSIKPWFNLRGLGQKSYSSKTGNEPKVPRKGDKGSIGHSRSNLTFSSLEPLDLSTLQTSLKKLISAVSRMKMTNGSTKCNCGCMPDFDKIIKAIKREEQKSETDQSSKLKKLYRKYTESK